MNHSKIVFNSDDCIQKKDYEIYTRKQYNKQIDQYFNDYIIRFNDGIIFEFIHDLEKDFDNYTILKPIQIDYILHVIDEKNLNKSNYNIKLKFINKTLWIHSINYKRGVGKRRNEYNKYLFQILCKKYINNLIKNYSEIFELLFSDKIENYKIKIRRRSEFVWLYDKNNFEMDFEKYLEYNDEKYPSDDIEEYFVSHVDIVDLTKNNEYIFKYNTILKSYYKNTLNEYKMLLLDELNEIKDMILRRDTNNVYLYYNRIEYIISLKNENKNYFVYNNFAICYYGINYKIQDIIKLNEDTVLINIGNYNFDSDHNLKEILKLESKDYSKITKYILGQINELI